MLILFLLYFLNSNGFAYFSYLKRNDNKGNWKNETDTKKHPNLAVLLIGAQIVHLANYYVIQMVLQSKS